MMVQTAFAAPNEDFVKDLAADLGTFNANAGESMTAAFKVVEGASSITAKITELNLALTPVVDPLACVAGMCPAAVKWDGKKDNAIVADGTYTLEVKAVRDADDDTDTGSVKVFTPLAISSYTVPATFDPAKGNLSIAYTLSKVANVTVKVLDGATEVKVLSGGSAASGTITWDGKVGGDLVFPKTYSVKLIATFAQETKEQSKDTVLSYADDLAPTITEIKPSEVVDKSFKANDEEVTVSFVITHTAFVTVEIKDKNGKVIYNPADLDGTKEYGNQTVSFGWKGLQNNGDLVDKGLYTVEITARNNTYGVAFDKSLVLDVDSTGSVYKPDTTKFTGISLDPSGAWDPLEEELVIDWELTTTFDKVTIEARKAGKTVEIYEEDDLDIDDDYTVDFEGKDDDDEYISQGKWILLFLGEKEGIVYYTEKSFTVGYAEPEIDEAFVTKSEIDPELGEGVYFGFKLKDDAKVFVEVLRDGKSRVDLVDEDGEEVDKDQWYAAFWDGLEDDGGEFDKDDSFKIQLKACSLGDDEVCNTESLTIDLDDDDTTSSKSNITKDILVPPVVEQDDDVELTFEMEDDAELRVGIWKGTSTSGTPDVELFPYTAMEEGDYKFVWDTRDEDGDLMAKGYYSYKIFTKKSGSSSTETESGKFVIGSVGDVFGGPSETVSDEEEKAAADYKDNPYLVIEEEAEEEPEEEVFADISFPDVLPSNKNYTAIAWATDADIFEGDPTGTFRPFDSINRVEVLTVVMKAFDLPFYADNGTNLGWTDVEVGAWYMGALRSGKLNGLLTGDGGKATVRPGDPVNRAEFLRFVYASAEITGVAAVGVCYANPYGDVSLSVGAWFTNYVCQSKVDGLFDVVGNMFLPGAETTRGEVAEALYRLLEQ